MADDQHVEQPALRKKKRATLAAALALILGPFGVFYIGWRYFICALLVEGITELPAVFLSRAFLFNQYLKPIDWRHVGISAVSPIFAVWSAWITSKWNERVSEGGTKGLRSFWFALEATTFLPLLTGLYFELITLGFAFVQAFESRKVGRGISILLDAGTYTGETLLFASLLSVLIGIACEKHGGLLKLW